MYNTNGKFIVKSAYKVAKKIQRGGNWVKVQVVVLGKRFGLHFGSFDYQIESKSSGGGCAMTYCPLDLICQEEGLLMRRLVPYVQEMQNQLYTPCGSALRFKTSG